MLLNAHYCKFSNSSYPPQPSFPLFFLIKIVKHKLRRMRQTRFVLFSCTGAEVLAQEPYVAVLDGNSQHKRCDRCFSLSSNLKRCSACKSVFYCCILCQVLSAISFLTQEAPLQALEQQNPFPPPSFCIIIIILLLCK